MGRLFYSFIVGVALSLSVASIALADAYDVGVVVNGQPLTVTVIVDSKLITATVNYQNAEISGIRAIVAELSVQEYVAQMDGHSLVYKIAISEIAHLLKDVESNPGVTSETTWEDRLKNWHAFAKTIVAGVHQMRPPQGLSDAHITAVSAINHLERLSNMIAEWSSSRDSDTLLSAYNEFESSANEWQSAMQQVRVYIADDEPFSTDDPQIKSDTVIGIKQNTNQDGITAIVVRNANLRSGPGTSFPITGVVDEGDEVVIAFTDESGDWYQLNDDRWIAAFLVSGDTSGIQIQQELPVADAGSQGEPTKKEVDAITEYYAKAQTFAARYAKGLSGSGELFIQLIGSPQLRFDGAWKNQIATHLALIVDTGKDIRATTVPPFLQPVHDSFLAAAKNFDDSVKISIKGIGSADGKVLNDAMSEMVAASEDVNEAGRLLQEIKEQYGIE